MRYFLLTILGLAVALMVYIRMAPHDVDQVHLQATPQGPGDYPTDGRFIAVRQLTAAPADVLNGVGRVAVAMDRTQVLAGSADQGIITFLTRSRLWGFPDYTTASIIPAGTVDNAGPLLMIEGRLRYGKYDMDVNKTRVEAILAALGPLTVPLDEGTSAQ